MKDTGATLKPFEVVVEQSIIDNLPKRAPPFVLNLYFFVNFIDQVLDYAIKNNEKGKYEYLVIDRFFDENEMN